MSICDYSIDQQDKGGKINNLNEVVAKQNVQHIYLAWDTAKYATTFQHSDWLWFDNSLLSSRQHQPDHRQ